MNIKFTKNAWEEFCYWIDNDPEIVIKIRTFLEEIKQNPFRGSGKPEPLKNQLQGFWSRRITQEHRLVYKVSGTRGVDQVCYVIQCRFHY